ncbi:hypothetical protein JCM6882_005736 [Rhodosporidiobolus microsporus]
MNEPASDGQRTGYESSTSPPPPSSHFNPVASTSRAGSSNGSVGRAAQARASYDLPQNGAQHDAAQHAGFAEDSDEEGDVAEGAEQGEPDQSLPHSVGGFAGDDDDFLDEDEPEDEDDDEDGEDDAGYGSEDIPLITVWRREQKKKEGVPGLFPPEDVLSEEDFGSKTVLEIYTMVQQGMIDLSPEYQRDTVWPVDHSRELVDSIFRNYHIPHLLYNIVTPDPDYKFYAFCKTEEQVDPTGTARIARSVMDSADKGKGKAKAATGEPGRGEVVREVWRCMDGKQRTTAICKFIDGDFTIVGKNGKKYTYQTLPDTAREIFNSRRLRYGFYRDLDVKEEYENFKRVQKGRALTKGEIRNATSSKYYKWVQKTMQQYFNSYKTDSFMPRITNGGRGKELDIALQCSNNILTAIRDGFMALSHQSSTIRDQILSSDELPTRDEQAEVQRVLARFHQLSLIPPLRGEDAWPKSKTGREMVDRGLAVPHRVWRITPKDVGDNEGGKRENTRYIAVAPVEVHMLAAVIWKYSYLNNGELLELIEQLRMHLHRNFRKEVKDNPKLYAAMKQWCQNFDADKHLKDKYRRDGTLRSKPRAEQLSKVAAPAAAPSASSSGRAISSTTAPAKKKKANPAPAAQQNGAASKGKGSASRVEYSPGAILPFGSPKTSKPAPPPPAPKPQPPSPQSGLFALPKPTSRKIPAPPPPAPAPASAPALFVKQAKFGKLIGGGLTGARAASPVVQKTQAQQIKSLPSSRKRGRDDVEPTYDVRGRRTVPGFGPGPGPSGSNGAGYGNGEEGEMPDLAEMGSWDYEAMEAAREVREATERANEALRKMQEVQRLAQQPGYRPPPRPDSRASDDRDIKRVKKEPDEDDDRMPRVDPAREAELRRQADVERQRAFEVQRLVGSGYAPSGGSGGPRPPGFGNGSRAPDDRYGGGGRDDYRHGGGRDGYSGSNRPDDRDRYSSSSYRAPYDDRRRDDRSRSRSPRRDGGYYGGGGGGGYGSRLGDDRGGYGGYGGGGGGSGARRDERASSVASSRSRLPSGVANMTVSGPNGYNVPSSGYGGGYSNGYSGSQPPPYSAAPGPADNAAAAYGQRGHALADQDSVRPPPMYQSGKTSDPRRKGPPGA